MTEGRNKSVEALPQTKRSRLPLYAGIAAGGLLGMVLSAVFFDNTSLASVIGFGLGLGIFIAIHWVFSSAFSR